MGCCVLGLVGPAGFQSRSITLSAPVPPVPACASNPRPSVVHRTRRPRLPHESIPTQSPLPVPPHPTSHSVILGRLLGEGGFAFVYACADAIDPSRRYVLKKILIQVFTHVGLSIVCGWMDRNRPTHWPLQCIHPPQPQPPQPQDEQARLSAEKEIRLMRLLQPCPQIVRFVDAEIRPGSAANCRVNFFL